ncbi:MAG: response regulator transcription factor [Kiritimatiellae bacterium]|nr:response regulator transcription factor [Kiritimatiellia bacterium]
MTDILIVEDERIFADRYVRLFADAGYSVRLAKTAAAAIAEFTAKRPGVVLLDVMLPGGNGYAVCRRMRELDEFVPIVFNTVLDGEEDMKRGLEIGGDDYVLKTGSDAERLARVARAAARYEAFCAARGAPGPTIEMGRSVVDCAKLCVTDGKGRTTSITRTEADILKVLASERGRLFSADEIIAAVRGEGFVCSDNMLYVHISRLRKRLGKAGNLLVSHRRSGYRLM